MQIRERIREVPARLFDLVVGFYPQYFEEHPIFHTSRNMLLGFSNGGIVVESIKGNWGYAAVNVFAYGVMRLYPRFLGYKQKSVLEYDKEKRSD
ncbi:MAG: hypothetical protein HYW23_01040 [Candidatus Aenigmarchaeota archaeon]|nr:hypothetical protein [Candidatus Aenigmarchaeota archaeon]